MNSVIYIKLFMVFMLSAIVAYCGVFMHYAGDEAVIIYPDITIWDYTYYTSVTVAHFLGSVSVSAICNYIEDNNPSLKIATTSKYFVYCLTAILLFRTSFCFRFYNEIRNAEILLDVASVIGIVLRWLFVSKGVKITLPKWHKLKYR